MLSERLGPFFKNKDKFQNFTLSSHKIWRQAIKRLRRDEKVLGLPYSLDGTLKTYALDGLIIARTMGISDKDSLLPLQIFSLYYLSIHIFDDLIEDPAKFYRQFRINDKYKSSRETGKETLVLSYVLNVLLSIYQLLSADNRYQKNGNEVFRNLLTSLGKFIRFFLIEHMELSPETILQIKMRGVSGIATGMIADLLLLKESFGPRVFSRIKKTLYCLGSLTQFTDDIRDYDVDRNMGNANLLLGLERKFGRYTQEKFKQWYIREELKMLHALRGSGIKTDTDLIRLIPWYPFWLG